MNENIAEMRFVSISEGTVCIGTICDICKTHNAKYASFGKCPEICFYNSTCSCTNHIPFHFFKHIDDSSIILFAKSRIPFDFPNENNEPLKELKKNLTSALSGLKYPSKKILYARYGTTDMKKRFFDVENALFYNIGLKHFHAHTKQRIIFETISPGEIISMQDQWCIPREYTHYYEYTLKSAPVFPPQAENLLAEWDNIDFCKCIGLTPALSWKSIKASQDKIIIHNKINCEEGDFFSLILKVEKPMNTKFNLMVALKPLLDGLICAFHSSIFESNDLEFFSKIVGCNEDILKCDKLNILGERKSKYIQKYRNSVKWNPADDLCHYVDISVVDGTAWRLSGKLYKHTASLTNPKAADL